MRWGSLLRSAIAAGQVLVVAVVLLASACPSRAVEPNEMLADPALEARAREISRELRCLVCQNESIDESNADLAHDLRVLVRDRLTAGDSDAQVVQFIVDRYGDFVLLRPPVKPATYLLWGSPLLLLVIAAAIIAAYLRRHRLGIASAPPRTGDEQKRRDDLSRAAVER